MTYHDIVEKVSKELNLSAILVDKAYKAYWFFIRTHIQSLPLKDTITQENFAKLQTNFNIPSLGKLTCTYDRMLNVKKRFKIIKNIREKNAKS